MITIAPELSVDAIRSSDIKSPMDGVLGRFMNALLPGNERMPEPSYLDAGYEADSETMPDIKTDEHTKSKAEQNVVKELQSKPLFVNPEVIDMLVELAEQTRNKSFESVLNSSEFSWVPIMFGLDTDAEAVLQFEEQEEAGQKISKKSTAIAVIDAVRSYIDRGYSPTEFNELFFTHFSAVNTRYHIDEIAFNFQADNVFARHVLNSLSSKEMITEQEEIEVFILSIAEELGAKNPEKTGVTANTIMHYQKPVSVSQSKKDGVQNILNGINILLGSSNKMPSIKDILHPLNRKDNSTSALLNSGKSPMHVAMLIEAVHDIRVAVANNGGKNGNWKTLEIETRKSIGFDGNTSGFTNKLINMLGGANHESILKMLTSLITPDSKTGKYGDAYTILANRVKTSIANKIELAKNGAGLPRDVRGVDELKVIMDFLNVVDSSMRATSKPPLMNNLYGQLRDNMSKILANSIAGKMINKSKNTPKNETNKTKEQRWKSVEQAFLNALHEPDQHE